MFHSSVTLGEVDEVGSYQLYKRGTFQEYRQLYLTEPQSKLQMFLV